MQGRSRYKIGVLQCVRREALRGINMKKELKIGIVIADNDEFAPLEKRCSELSATPVKVAGRKGYTFSLGGEKGSADVTAVECGIGKVNAAAATTALCEQGVHIILNCGLSGGISGVSRNEISIPNKFVEHDFDLTGLGYKLCQKPNQEYVYNCDNELLEIARKIIPDAKVGTAATGDCFVQNEALRDLLKSEFSAMSCDMETAAMAYVCAAYGVKFLSVRKVSDDAGSEAGDAYRELNNLSEDTLINYLLEIINAIIW